MNDRYLYRAKRTYNGEWVKGYYRYIPCLDEHNILPINPRNKMECYMVDTSTICQCTGLIDRWGTPIFERDIVIERHSERIGEVKFGEHEKGYGWYIEWISEKAKFYRVDFLYWQKEVSLDVIGNMFDNPELLEVGE